MQSAFPLVSLFTGGISALLVINFAPIFDCRGLSQAETGPCEPCCGEEVVKEGHSGSFPLTGRGGFSSPFVVPAISMCIPLNTIHCMESIYKLNVMYTEQAEI